MNAYRILIDENTLGYTEPSLRRLRNELARRIDHKIQVHQIQTESICAGFLIVDVTVGEAVWSGDGFRTDGGGEGGAGTKTAETLFTIFDITPYYGEIAVGNGAVTVTELEALLKKYLEDFTKENDEPFGTTTSKRKAQYIR